MHMCMPAYIHNHIYVHGSHTVHVFALWLLCNYVATRTTLQCVMNDVHSLCNYTNSLCKTLILTIRSVSAAYVHQMPVIYANEAMAICNIIK